MTTPEELRDRDHGWGPPTTYDTDDRRAFWVDYGPPVETDPDTGGVVIFDHASRTPTELDADVCELAMDYGWMADDWQELDATRRLVASARRGDPSWRGHKPADYLQWLSDAANDARDYLSDLVPDGWYVDNDGYAGAFGIWRTDEDGGDR